jgi:hypothetical protein
METFEKLEVWREGKAEVRHAEPLSFEEVQLATRSYK